MYGSFHARCLLTVAQRQGMLAGGMALTLLRGTVMSLELRVGAGSAHVFVITWALIHDSHLHTAMAVIAVCLWCATYVRSWCCFPFFILL